MDKPNVSAIIVAGGTGKRFGNLGKKQFFELNGKPVLYYSIDAFDKCKLISEIILVLPAENMDYYDSTLAKIQNFENTIKVTEGGELRQDSVYKGLNKVSKNTDVVLVHDAARPLVSLKIIEQVIQHALLSDCAICALPVNDTLKQATADLVIEKTIPRDGLWLAQTPQGFKYHLLKSAMKYANDNKISGTDESSFVEQLGIKPVIVEGSKYNLKITNPEDLKLAEYYLKEMADV